MDWLDALISLATLGTMAYFALRRSFRRATHEPLPPHRASFVSPPRSVVGELVFQVGVLVVFLGRAVIALLDLVRSLVGHATPSRDEPRPMSNAPCHPVFATATGESEIMPFASWWSTLRDATHVIISGGKGSGKTTAARALVVDLAAHGATVVLVDPHHRRGDWGDVRPFCAGRRIEEARHVFGWAIAEIDRRYKRRADEGVESFDEVVIVVDELDLFTAKRPDVPADLRTLAGQFVAMCGDETRKIGLRLIVIAHGTEVENLGLSGVGSKRDNYATLLLRAGDAGPEATGTLVIGSKTYTVETQPLRDRARAMLVTDALHPIHAETVAEIAQSLPFAETPVLPVAISSFEDDPFSDMDFTPLARLVQADIVGETKLLEIAFGVRPGSSRTYLAARAKLKAALRSQ